MDHQHYNSVSYTKRKPRGKKKLQGGRFKFEMEMACAKSFKFYKT